jgi:hypothetical protein
MVGMHTPGDGEPLEIMNGRESSVRAEQICRSSEIVKSVLTGRRHSQAPSRCHEVASRNANDHG